VDAREAGQLVAAITRECEGLECLRLMEVCGTHTVNLFRSGVKSLMPEKVRLISGPGCPVCVTSQGYLEAACEVAARPGVTICTYGDMVRVPGATGSLAERRAEGAKVAVVYSARDALRLARKQPERKFVFLAVGFETTAPATAAVVVEAEEKDVGNFFVLCGHKLVIPAMRALLTGGEVPIDGFLCPGHVSVVIGARAYRPIAEGFGKPCVVAGFEPRQMLEGILHLARQAARGESRVENVYGVAVTDEGNVMARRWMDKVFSPAPSVWRAIGTLPESGLELRPAYRRFDALEHFGVSEGDDVSPPGCRCGDVIQGKVSPPECGLFGKACTPVRPVGPCMVSSEGTCAAWYKYELHAESGGGK